MLRHFDALACDKLGHNVRRCQRHRAPMTRKRCFLDNAVLHSQLERHFITAAGVYALLRVVRVLKIVFVVGVRVVRHQRRRINISSH